MEDLMDDARNGPAGEVARKAGHIQSATKVNSRLFAPLLISLDKLQKRCVHVESLSNGSA